MSFFSSFFKQKPQPQPKPQEKAKSEFTDSEVQTVVAMSEHLVEVINESLQVSNNSKNIDTKLSRLAVAKEKLNELKEISKKYPFIEITQLSEVELSIKALELEFELAGYRAVAEGNSEGSRLEKDGFKGVTESVQEENFNQFFDPEDKESLPPSGSMKDSLVTEASINPFESTPRTVPRGHNGSEDIQLIEEMGERLVFIIKESIQIANDTKDRDVRASRVMLAKDKLKELQSLASQSQYFSITGLDVIQSAIAELETKSDDFEEYVNLVYLGKKLEKEGKLEEAVEKYDKLVKGKVDVPLPYRRLAILYRKLKDDDKELRVIREALANLSEPTMGNHYTWFQDRLKKKLSKQ